MAPTATMQLQLQQTRRASRQVAGSRAFVSAPVARKVAVQQPAVSSRAVPSRMVAVKAVAEAKAPASSAAATQVCQRGIWVGFDQWGCRVIRPHVHAWLGFTH
jgi:hypothetical protein